MNTNEAAILIQKWYRHQVLSRLFKKHIVIEGRSYDDFILFSMNKIHLKLLSAIAKNVNIKHIMVSRMIFSASAISIYPDEVCTVDSPEKIMLIKHSNYFWKTLSYSMYNTNGYEWYNVIRYLFGLFVSNFEEWKKIDHQRMVESLINSYGEIVVTNDFILQNNPDWSEDERTIWINEVEKHKDVVRNNMKMIGGDITLLDRIHPLKEESEKFINNIKQISEKAFWDTLESELKSEPPVYDMLISLYTEIRDRLVNIVYNDSKKEEITNMLDVDLFKQMLTNNACNYNDMIEWMDKLFICIEGIQAPIYDAEINQEKYGLINDLSNGKHISEVICCMYKGLFVRLDQTEKEIKEWRERLIK